MVNGMEQTLSAMEQMQKQMAPASPPVKKQE
jgi:hypothetical protein